MEIVFIKHLVDNTFGVGILIVHGNNTKTTNQSLHLRLFIINNGISGQYLY